MNFLATNENIVLAIWIVRVHAERILGIHVSYIDRS